MEEYCEIGIDEAGRGPVLGKITGANLENYRANGIWMLLLAY